ncbi:MAG: F0F1 ATP synthase subunit epsilon [Gammaproteobacteria bacterium]|nr:F0F1 ATP synthase subunit epsilon [Gammaproteobacteria bacterium]NIR43265.1 F0F1 ATP synthase subunit epsilon [Gemmatimonadota bacterium]NIR96585.1 F0F1 ATP synthase subunit epsilon [Gammaproteobacteria bacterium]NIT62723.1 F0F1 ATP synthase subunit epsilon [Gammaproteobacteria bacterium]NIV19681.1 F0F1 ATP synthase subunit epsilon [Gammaproteobacteria bacterium]
MRLKVLLPTEVLVDAEAVKIVAEAENGAFGLLPRHVDFVAGLTAGILTYEAPDGEEVNLAVNEGTLVKCGRDVLVSTRAAVRGPDLASLEGVVKREFAAMDEHERRARSALTRLEAGTLRRFIELQELEHGG